MKTVLLTGGSGFLGRHIQTEAEAQGYKVLAPRSSELDLVSGDGVDDYIEAAISEHGTIDTIIHSAAYYGGIGINQAEQATIFFQNSQMTLTVFEIARRHDIRKVIPIGSACAYPGALAGDLEEKNLWDGALHESVEAYGSSKRLQLIGQHAYNKQHGIEGNHLVLANMYGPNDVFNEYRGHVVGSLIKKFVDAKLKGDNQITLWGDGTPQRDFIFVQDAARAIVLAIDLPHDLDPINIGTGEATPIKELATLIANSSGFEGEIIWDTTKPNGVPRKVLSTKRCQCRLGFEPKTTLAEGIADTVGWYSANKEEADARPLEPARHRTSETERPSSGQAGRHATLRQVGAPECAGGCNLPTRPKVLGRLPIRTAATHLP